MLCSMLGVGILKNSNLLILQPTIFLSFIIQVMLGIMVGLTVVNLKTNDFKKLGISLGFITLLVLIMTFETGFILTSLTNLDYKIAIISSAPGSLPEMATLANALNLNAPIIVILHLVRVILVMVTYSIIINYFYKKNIREANIF